MTAIGPFFGPSNPAARTRSANSNGATTPSAAYATSRRSTSPAVRFGLFGGLLDILYCGFGFTHTRRDVYDRVRRHHDLAECSNGFRVPLVAADGRGDP